MRGLGKEVQEAIIAWCHEVVTHETLFFLPACVHSSSAPASPYSVHTHPRLITMPHLQRLIVTPAAVSAGG